MPYWRERLLTSIGPGMCSSITFGDWLALLRENRFAIDPPLWLRAEVISVCSLPDTALRSYVYAVYGRGVWKAEVKAPTFILGFWRSGTTHMPNLLTVHQRFAYHNLYQVYFPHNFLC